MLPPVLELPVMMANIYRIRILAVIVATAQQQQQQQIRTPNVLQTE